VGPPVILRHATNDHAQRPAIWACAIRTGGLADGFRGTPRHLPVFVNLLGSSEKDSIKQCSLPLGLGSSPVRDRTSSCCTENSLAITDRSVLWCDDARGPPFCAGWRESCLARSWAENFVDTFADQCQTLTRSAVIRLSLVDASNGYVVVFEKKQNSPLLYHGPWPCSEAPGVFVLYTG
jgi:hypothetical protein